MQINLNPCKTTNVLCFINTRCTKFLNLPFFQWRRDTPPCEGGEREEKSGPGNITILSDHEEKKDFPLNHPVPPLAGHPSLRRRGFIKKAAGIQGGR